MRILPSLALSALILAPIAAQAQSRPPEDARPLSEILAIVEEREGVVSFTDIDWDRDGYWEVEFFTETGKVEMNIDPITGEPRMDD
ncbi:PepSY domain-containing protein [Plastorhodobacter daqingensis]|uniref:PepSY domain-containing protein n=1 Tax=Plastorhodobacter daqingensis TaxID=1387281 RepID=A0ABW2USI0_9RHOB